MDELADSDDIEGNQLVPGISNNQDDQPAYMNMASPAEHAEDALSDLVLQLEDCQPTIPDCVTSHYLSAAGFESKDPRMIRLISLAAQKFIAEIAADALQHCKMKSAAQSKKQTKEKQFTLTMDDLIPALADHGINIVKPPYFP